VLAQPLASRTPRSPVHVQVLVDFSVIAANSTIGLVLPLRSHVPFTSIFSYYLSASLIFLRPFFCYFPPPAQRRPDSQRCRLSYPVLTSANGRDRTIRNCFIFHGTGLSTFFGSGGKHALTLPHTFRNPPYPFFRDLCSSWESVDVGPPREAGAFFFFFFFFPFTILVVPDDYLDSFRQHFCSPQGFILSARIGPVSNGIEVLVSTFVPVSVNHWSRNAPCYRRIPDDGLPRSTCSFIILPS